ncbi:MAG: hypothetical protein ACRC8Z_14125 [Empedobacter falsenii]
MKLKYILTLLAVLCISLVQAQCPPGSKPPTFTSNTIEAGETYCVSSNISGVNSLTIKPGGKLIIAKGAKVDGSGTFTIDGDLELQDKAGLNIAGGISLGTVTNNNTYLRLGKNAFISITGSIMQYDVTHQGFYTGVTGQIEMDSHSVMEICGTYTFTSQDYKAIKYVGNPNEKAYFITKSTVSGGGANSMISDESQINWIAMGTTTSIEKGNATYCGSNATSATCPLIWPRGLSDSSCGQARDITENLPGVCYQDPNMTTTPKESKVGITLLKRTNPGSAEEWLKERNSAHLVLESNTKGFVVTRIAKADLGNIISPQEGMMVYDNTDKCLKIYSDNDWKCFNTPACP